MKEWTVVAHPSTLNNLPDVMYRKAESAVEAIEGFHKHASKIVPEPVVDYLGCNVWKVEFRGRTYYCIEPQQ